MSVSVIFIILSIVKWMNNCGIRAVQLWRKCTGVENKHVVRTRNSVWMLQWLSLTVVFEHFMLPWSQDPHGQLGTSTGKCSHLAKCLLGHHNNGIRANKGTWRKVYDAGECLHWSSSAGVSLSRGACPLRNKCEAYFLHNSMISFPHWQFYSS